MTNEEKDQFENITFDFSKRKLDYNYSELQRIKDRAHQIVAFFLVISSIISASLASSSIEKLLEDQLVLGILITGFGLIVLTISLSFKIMVGRQKNYVIDPKLLYKFYKDSTLQETREMLRDTIFEMIDIMDERNLKLHYKMGKIYCLSVCSLIIIFIPMIWLLFNE